MTEHLIAQLTDPLLFEPAGAALDIISQVEEVIAEIDARRPLPQTVLDRLQTDIFYDRIHSSAVTEGNRLSRRETIVVLTTGLVDAGSRKDQLEVKNLAEAILALEEALKSKSPMKPFFLRNLHALVMKDLDDKVAGKYRDYDLTISGAKIRPPSFLDVPDMVRSVLDAPAFNAAELSPVQKAAWAHWAIARVYPFGEGNGRTARLVQDYILLRDQYVPAPLSAEDREGEYYAALESADFGDGKPLLELVAKNTIRTADKYLSIIRDEDAKVSWIASITKAATEKVRETEHRHFLAVQRASNILKTEFDAIASQLNERIPDLSVRLRDYGGLPFEKYHEIKTRGTAKRTWFFGIEFEIAETTLRYIFWYGSHHSYAYDTADEVPSDVVLLVSAEEEHKYYRLLDDLGEDRVTVRELVPGHGEFWRRRYNPILERHDWDQGVTAGQVAMDFYQEVISKLGLI